MMTMLTYLLLIASFELEYPCMSTENTWQTTTTTTTPKSTTTSTTSKPMFNVCVTCDLAALYSETFCPAKTGCQSSHPLMVAATVINSSMPPCIQVKSFCPKNAFIGVDLGTEQLSIASSSYDDTIQIVCNRAGQWMATVNDSKLEGMYNINQHQSTLASIKTCSTCDSTIVKFEPTICDQDQMCKDPMAKSVFEEKTKCNVLRLTCDGMLAFKLRNGTLVNEFVDISMISCVNGEYELRSESDQFGLPLNILIYGIQIYLNSVYETMILPTMLVLSLSIKASLPCLSTENPWATTTTTTTATPMNCGTCDLAALYSSTFCPAEQSCQFNYPLIDAAMLINSATSPCIEVRNLCPPDAFVGVALEKQDTTIISRDYDQFIDITCNSAGQWIATVDDPTLKGIHNINKLTCFTRKSCATCQEVVILPSMTACGAIDLENAPGELLAEVVFDEVTNCTTLLFACQLFGSIPVLELQNGNPVPLTNGVATICVNGVFELTSANPMFSGRISRGACCVQPMR